MKEYQYKIRAHHGMCLAFFVGKGYSDGFTKHMREVKIKVEENLPVCITCMTDEICRECPNNIQGNCATAEKVAEYDRKVLSKCGLAQGEVLPFLEFQKLVYDNILLPGKREEICGDCNWSALCHLRRDYDDEGKVVGTF